MSCSEPQLGMMVNQLRRGSGGLGIGFASGEKGVNLFERFVSVVA